MSDLINPNSFQWDRNFPVFNSQTARKIRNIHISPTQSQDKFIWVPNSSGKFKTKSAFLTFPNPTPNTTSPLISKDCNSLWNAKICVRFKVILQKNSMGHSSHKSHSSTHISSRDQSCIFCKGESKTAFHLFTRCPFVQSVWLSSSWPLHLDHALAKSMYPPPSLLKRPQNFYSAAVICDQIWFQRSELIKSPITPTPSPPPPPLQPPPPVCTRDKQKISLPHPSLGIHKQPKHKTTSYPLVPTPSWLVKNQSTLMQQLGHTIYSLLQCVVII